MLINHPLAAGQQVGPELPFNPGISLGESLGTVFERYF